MLANSFSSSLLGSRCGNAIHRLACLVTITSFCVSGVVSNDLDDEFICSQAGPLSRMLIAAHVVLSHRRRLAIQPGSHDHARPRPAATLPLSIPLPGPFLAACCATSPRRAFNRIHHALHPFFSQRRGMLLAAPRLSPSSDCASSGPLTSSGSHQTRRMH